MNKAQLIEALAERLGDKKTASQAVEDVVDIIVRNVNKGEKVNITGFGVFEKRARAARTARNPRTGETVKVKKTNVPAFRAGTQFKEVVGGQRKLPRVSGSKAGTARGQTTRTTSASRTKAASTRSTAASSTSAKTSRATTKASTAKAGASKADTSKARPTKNGTSKARTDKADRKSALLGKREDHGGNRIINKNKKEK